ncbi:MAG: YggT family protein [SAR202 cluster bacterium]|nr:YggT family protein [SAR202 cluster bacterium]
MAYFANFLSILILVLQVAIIARVFASWFVRDPDNPFMNFLVGITEPILAPLRRILPNFGRVDLSPMIAIAILVILRVLLVPALRG